MVAALQMTGELLIIGFTLVLMAVPQLATWLPSVLNRQGVCFFDPSGQRRRGLRAFHRTLDTAPCRARRPTRAARHRRSAARCRLWHGQHDGRARLPPFGSPRGRHRRGQALPRVRGRTRLSAECCGTRLPAWTPTRGKSATASSRTTQPDRLRELWVRAISPATSTSPPTGAGGLIVHAGYHFTADCQRRRQAEPERLERAVDLTSAEASRCFWRTHKPNHAEAHYLCSALEECLWYFDRLVCSTCSCPSPRTTRTSTPKASRALSTRWISPDAGRSALPFARRLRAAPQSRRRHDGFRRHVPADRGGGLSRPLHEPVRHPRRHAAGAAIPLEQGRCVGVS